MADKRGYDDVDKEDLNSLRIWLWHFRLSQKYVLSVLLNTDIL